ncbi:hypothetical protein C8Q74DRAFT_1405299 [Fomes fomentarius]|nr:hypothetical protein C8Q74DRAFT_1405299 [Fomes fomentarius]
MSSFYGSGLFRAYDDIEPREKVRFGTNRLPLKVESLVVSVGTVVVIFHRLPAVSQNSPTAKLHTSELSDQGDAGVLTNPLTYVKDGAGAIASQEGFVSMKRRALVQARDSGRSQAGTVNRESVDAARLQSPIGSARTVFLNLIHQKNGTKRNRDKLDTESDQAMVITRTESTKFSDPDLTINCVSGLVDNIETEAPIETSCTLDNSLCDTLSPTAWCKRVLCTGDTCHDSKGVLVTIPSEPRKGRPKVAPRLSDSELLPLCINIECDGVNMSTFERSILSAVATSPGLRPPRRVQGMGCVDCVLLHQVEFHGLTRLHELGHPLRRNQFDVGVKLIKVLALVFVEDAQGRLRVEDR